MTSGLANSEAVARLAPPIPFALSVLLLALLASTDALELVPATLVAVLVAELLRRYPVDGPNSLWVLPPIAVAGVAIAIASPSLTSELLAAAAGLSLLYWIAAVRTRHPFSESPTAGLLLPGLSVALALLVTFFLPGGPARLDLASALLVVVLLLVGWAIRSDPARSAAGAARS